MKKINENNLILKSDSYKYSQARAQYVQGSESLFSYLSSRGGVFPATVFIGLQYYIEKYLTTPITIADVEEAKEFFEVHGVEFYYDGWMYIAKELKGKLPVHIRAVPEGMLVPTGNILLTIESTDPKAFWVVNWLETLLLKVWYPTTVGSQSFYLRKTVYDALIETSDNPNAEIDFKVHSFGYRGVSSEESAAIGGMAELLSFKGTDTIAGIVCANNYYDAGICGFSINASEHSTMTSFGKEHEVEAYRNMIQQFGKPGKIFACVADSYNVYNACSELFGTQLKQEIIDSGATLVIRLDSGIPIEVITKCFDILSEKFGYTINLKGFKVLNYVRLIQGDGINPVSIKEIITAITKLGWSLTNLSVGMGGASLSGSIFNVINRDTQKFAFKASSLTVNGEEVNIIKDPITDPGKRSKSGRLDLIKNESGQFETVKLENQDVHPLSIMSSVYKNGEQLIKYDFETIRNLMRQQEASI